MRFEEQRNRFNKIKKLVELNPFLADSKIAKRCGASTATVRRVRMNVVGIQRDKRYDPDFFTPEELNKLDNWLAARGLLEELS
jgi:hypothetical protein